MSQCFQACEARIHELRVFAGAMAKSVAIYQRKVKAKDAELAQKDVSIEKQGAELERLLAHRRALVHAHLKNKDDLEVRVLFQGAELNFRVLKCF